MKPFFFSPNRVWRCYTGGLLLDRFVGNRPEKDGYFPEEWLASTVKALNGDRSQGPDEGLARVERDDCTPGDLFTDVLKDRGREILGQAHTRRYGADLAFLCKLLDSSVRLPIQCHPDREVAKHLFQSDYGKTESWCILETRSVSGVEPYVLLGFKPGIDPDIFAQAVMKQDIIVLESLLHKVPVRAGDNLFVPARMPHAIGPGVLMLEVQEPTDWVIQPERFCAGTELSHTDMWGSLSPEKGLTVFHYQGYDFDSLVERVRPPAKLVKAEGGGTIREVFGPDQTTAFLLWNLDVRDELPLELPRGFAIMLVVEGSGTIAWKEGEAEIAKGSFFLLPQGLEKAVLRAKAEMSLFAAMPPSP